MNIGQSFWVFQKIRINRFLCRLLLNFGRWTTYSFILLNLAVFITIVDWFWLGIFDIDWLFLDIRAKNLIKKFILTFGSFFCWVIQRLLNIIKNLKDQLILRIVNQEVHFRPNWKKKLNKVFKILIFGRLICYHFIKYTLRNEYNFLSDHSDNFYFNEIKNFVEHFFYVFD